MSGLPGDSTIRLLTCLNAVAALAALAAAAPAPREADRHAKGGTIEPHPGTFPAGDKLA